MTAPTPMYEMCGSYALQVRDAKAAAQRCPNRGCAYRKILRPSTHAAISIAGGGVRDEARPADFCRGLVFTFRTSPFWKFSVDLLGKNSPCQRNNGNISYLDFGI